MNTEAIRMQINHNLRVAVRKYCPYCRRMVYRLIDGVWCQRCRLVNMDIMKQYSDEKGDT